MKICNEKRIFSTNNKFKRYYWMDLQKCHKLYLFRKPRVIITSGTAKILFEKSVWILLVPLVYGNDWRENHAEGFGAASTAGAAVESHPVNYREGGRQIIASPGADRKPHNCGPYGFTGGTSSLPQLTPDTASQSVSRLVYIGNAISRNTRGPWKP